MEDIVEEPILDIDSCDSKNTLEVVDYIDDIYAHYKKTEEKSIVNTLQFNMSVPTSYVFMKRFLKAAQSDKKLELLSFFLIELSLVDQDMLRFPVSLLAAEAIYTAQCTLNRTRHWSKTTEWHSNYSEDQLQIVLQLVVKVVVICAGKN
ncbi:hypothetical protein MKW92_018130 [Papaver armeniacum]|nr:hypothetical protein MKW92_018130 [Papaver armeniacum]